MPNIWVCPKCETPEGEPLTFDTVEEFQAHNAKAHGKDTKKPKPPVKTPNLPPPPKPEPVKLTYTWIGSCPHCNVPIETIPLDIDARTKSIVVIAWCPSCKKKLEQQEVAKL